MDNDSAVADADVELSARVCFPSMRLTQFLSRTTERIRNETDEITVGEFDLLFFSINSRSKSLHIVFEYDRYSISFLFVYSKAYVRCIINCNL